MALVNPNIAMSYRGVELPQQNALADYAAIQQIQGGRQTQELNALKMQEAQRTARSQNVLADAYAQSIDETGKIDYNKLTSLVAAGGGGAQLPGIQKSRFEQESASTKLLSDKLALLPNAYKMADTPEAYLALHQSVHADPVVGPWLKSVGATPEKGLATLQNAVQTGKFDELRMGSMQSVAQLLEGMKPIMVSPGASVFQGGKSVFTAPAAPAAPPVSVAEFERAKTDPAFMKFLQDRAVAMRPPAQPRAESPLVAIVGPDGSPMLVSRENAVGKTPANTAEKPMTQAQRVKYNKDKVSDKDVVTGAFAVTGELEKLTDELVGNPDKKIAPAPGLSSITGFSALTNPLALPSGDARKALQKLETFKGKIMALGRQLASQEGKLGNMAVQEWKFVSDAVQKIDPAAGNLDEQMRDVVRQAREYSQRQQSKYDDTYADDLATQGGSTAPAKPALSPIDKQALEWANSNSADPRAAAIKQRLGM
jgi:hypothetical protein